MILSINQWHQRYVQQASWTRSIRNYLFNRIDIQHVNSVLDIGCGTGVLLNELAHISSCSAYGVDINSNSISYAKKILSKALLTVGNALNLPFLTGSFDVALCHFLLLWVNHPQQALREMVRVVRPGGFILALAEPDYGGRIDFPSELSQIGRWQSESLKQQGANPLIGRELRSLFSAVGLTDIEVGTLGAQWRDDFNEEDIKLEYEVLESDLANNNELLIKVKELKELDLSAYRNHQRILYVPTFYAIGNVKS